MLLPILDGLRAVHAKGFLHRDIKPQNIYLARIDSGGVRPILLDFGAARQAMGERSRSVSVLYTPGYAPYEQYHSKGHQGPWTDIYSVAAVLYCLVTGVTPPEAIERRDQDDLQPAAAFGASQRLSEALSAGLALAAAARPQTVQQFQAQLWDASAGQGTGAERSGPAAQESPPTPPGSRGWPWRPVLFVVLLPLLGLAGWGWERYQDEQLRLRTDERAYAAARQSDSDTAYQVYLSACAANGCAHQAPAEQRLRELALEASRSAEAAHVAAAAQAAAARAEEAARNAAATRAAEDARTAAAARKQEQARAADRAAFAAAAKADTVEAYQAYLTGCADTGCEKRAQAKKRLTALAQAARAAEAQRAAEQAQAAPAAQSQRGVYADRAKRTEEEAGTWAYYAEQYARLRGCEVTESGVHLINSADRMETYKVRCTNSDAYLVQCQNEACRGLNQ